VVRTLGWTGLELPVVSIGSCHAIKLVVATRGPRRPTRQYVEQPEGSERRSSVPHRASQVMAGE
jgi:hypothetical protein